jgi:hypothetical protein
MFALRNRAPLKPTDLMTKKRALQSIYHESGPSPRRGSYLTTLECLRCASARDSRHNSNERPVVYTDAYHRFYEHTFQRNEPRHQAPSSPHLHVVQRVDPRRQQRVGAFFLVPLEEVAQLDVRIVRGSRPHPRGRQLAAARVDVLAGALPADLGVDAQVLAGAEPEGQDLGLLPQFLLLVRLQLAQLLEHLRRGSEIFGTKRRPLHRPWEFYESWSLVRDVGPTSCS